MSTAPPNDERAVAAQGARVLARARFDDLLDALARRGYKVIGPTLGEGAIVHEEVRSASDLPVGWTEDQDGATYRLRRRDDEALFGYALGPHSWKKHLHPPVLRLWSAKRDADGGFTVSAPDDEPERLAFLGVRSCDLHAISHLDDALMEIPDADAGYASRRRNAFIVAVNCTEPGGTCFCVSMNTGPRASAGYDVALTEVIDPEGHWFLVEPGSEAGAELVAELDTAPAGERHSGAASAALEEAAGRMGRELDTTEIKELLYRNYDNPRWDDAASRCLTCGNCTMVCPTCFCTTVEDHTDLAGVTAERVREWDSCFTMDFSYLSGGSVRSSGKARYRQWMTHKLATWFDQFGTSGCVGCGRCITWCPVAIDITEEAAAIRASEAPATGPSEALR
jgi:ferredoxin